MTLIITNNAEYRAVFLRHLSFVSTDCHHYHGQVLSMDVDWCTSSCYVSPVLNHARVCIIHYLSKHRLYTRLQQAKYREVRDRNEKDRTNSGTGERKGKRSRNSHILTHNYSLSLQLMGFPSKIRRQSYHAKTRGIALLFSKTARS